MNINIQLNAIGMTVSFNLYSGLRTDSVTRVVSTQYKYTMISHSVNTTSVVIFPTQALVFTCLPCKCFENTVGKGKIARNEQFFLFPQCFLPVWITFCHFRQI